jgi:hypothetical protein
MTFEIGSTAGRDGQRRAHRRNHGRRAQFRVSVDGRVRLVDARRSAPQGCRDLPESREPATTWGWPSRAHGEWVVPAAGSLAPS